MKGLIVTTQDGFKLSAKCFEADSEKWVIIGTATGAIKEYYQKFAMYLAENGWNTIIYDNRGTGASIANDEPYISMLDWGTKDMNAVINWVHAQGATDIKLVGHSISGQVFPFAPNASKVSGAYFVAAQNVSIKNWKGRSKFLAWLFWYIVIPLTTRIFGCLPGKVVGGNSEDLPRGVGLDWAAFGKHRNGIIQNNDERKLAYERITIPIMLIALEDDHLFAPYRAVQALKEDYQDATVGMELLKPGDYQVSCIGHFGFFRSKFKEKLWPKALNWLNEH